MAKPVCRAISPPSANWPWSQWGRGGSGGGGGGGSGKLLALCLSMLHWKCQNSCRDAILGPITNQTFVSGFGVGWEFDSLFSEVWPQHWPNMFKLLRVRELYLWAQKMTRELAIGQIFLKSIELPARAPLEQTSHFLSVSFLTFPFACTENLFRKFASVP